jgi:ribonuclease HI
MSPARPASGDHGAVVVYTDGACSGNPGPGGWAWAGAPDGVRHGEGGEAPTTNQRMEVAAVLDALRVHADGPVVIVSDSTYVVKCFQDRWWEGWLRKGWRNSQRQPVANRDLWEPLISLYRARAGEITFRWVKGHSGDPMNDLVDELAVAAARDAADGRFGVALDRAAVNPSRGSSSATPQDEQTTLF